MKHSLKDQAGELTIDHKDSPGITLADVAHIPGAIAVGKGEVYTTGTKGCAHCDRTVVLNPQRTRPRSYCSKCDAYICDDPICNSECNPIRKVFDEIQNAVGKGKTISEDKGKIILTDA